MKLIPKRKLLPRSYPEGDIQITTENINEVINNFNNSLSQTFTTNTYITEITKTIVEGVIGTLDDILDGITYGRVLQTNLSSGALKIITAQTALLDLIPATTNTSDLGSDTYKYAEGHIKKAYHDTRCQIPAGTDMYDV